MPSSLLICARPLAISGILVIHHVVLGMNANNNIRDSADSAALAEIGNQEAVIKNHRDESVPATCTRNT